MSTVTQAFCLWCALNYQKYTKDINLEQLWGQAAADIIHANENQNKKILTWETDWDDLRLENTKYNIDFLPNALIDYNNTTNDSLNYKVATRQHRDYGNLIIVPENGSKYPYLLPQKKADRGSESFY